MKKQKNEKAEKKTKAGQSFGAKSKALKDALSDKMPSFSMIIGVLCCILVFVATKVFEKYAAGWGEWWLFGFRMVHWAALVVAIGLVAIYAIMTAISVRNERKETESCTLSFGEVPGTFAFTEEDLKTRLNGCGFTEKGDGCYTKTEKGVRYAFLFGKVQEEILPARAAVDLLIRFAACGFAEKEQHLLLMIEKPGVSQESLRGMDLSAIAEEAGYGEWKGNLVSFVEGKDGAAEIGETVYPTFVFCDPSGQKLFWSEKSDRDAGDAEWNALLFTGEEESASFTEEDDGTENEDVLRQALEKTEEESGGLAKDSDGEKADGGFVEGARDTSAESVDGTAKSVEGNAESEK